MRYSIIILLCCLSGLCSKLDAQIVMHNSVRSVTATADTSDKRQDIPSMELITRQFGFIALNENSEAPLSLDTLLITQYHFMNTRHPELILPAYTQGIFCDFEDMVNRDRKLRIDFSVK